MKLDESLLKKYAQVMVHYAVNNGEGIKKGDTVFLVGQEYTKDLFMAIAKEVYEAGGNLITNYQPNNIKDNSLIRFLLQNGTDDQIGFFAKPYWQGIVDATDHILFIISEPDIHYLEGIPASKISRMNSARAPYMKMRELKEQAGKLSWTLCLYGTSSMAEEAGLSLEEYWEQIIEACYLREDDPVSKWKTVQREIEDIKDKLDALEIDTLHIKGSDVDLQVKIGPNRKWLSGGGKNIPSFEIFTSPDWRGTNGTIHFNQPLYYSGKRISDITLQFENGVVVSSSATENEDALKEMIAQENADKVGEYSLTDKRHSRITKFMANTLFDENMGGAFGNTHIALGNAYKDTFPGDWGAVTEEQWAEMGYNSCPKVHTDIISTSDRTVTARLQDGTEKVIYKDGQFVLE
ncbi:thermophilic metalloprotease (M29) superfamily [Flavisolibacter tropicus]|uniref:Thermophilic metalloprotease (M29) superfamily n=2 Tax=Flavisolibacter tropicus TaxID=1492898 RepID=A0A172U275_9BACT|nr:thermophilic metalloprotease (M29) superfamily [Flavisolibacter tropicus]